jgi:hypothetical protein
MCGGHGVERLRSGNAGGEATGVDERGEFCKAWGVGSDPDVVHVGAAQRRRRGAGRDGHERTAVADGLERRDFDDGGVECPVDATWDHAADSRPDILGAGDELVGTKLANERLVSRRGDRDGAQTVQGGQLQREPSERSRCSRYE